MRSSARELTVPIGRMPSIPEPPGRQSNGTPLGPALDSRLEHIEFRLARIEDSVGEVRERLAFGEGRSWAQTLARKPERRSDERVRGGRGRC